MLTYSGYLIISALIMIAGSAYVIVRTRDYLHPAVVMMPLLLFMYSIWPLYQNRSGAIDALIGRTNLEFVGFIYVCGLLAFYLGVTRLPGSKILEFFQRQSDIQGYLFHTILSRRVRRKLYSISILLGVVSIAAYIIMISNVGGFVDAYDSAKGGGYAPSGYIGEAVLLSFPAVIIFAMSKSGVRIRTTDVIIALIMISPQLIQGTLGGRRGPLFLCLATLFISWFIAKRRKPSLKVVMIGITAMGLAVLLVMSQRQHLYIGSGQSFDFNRFSQTIDVEDIRYSDYIAGVASVLKSRNEQEFYYGYRHFVTLFIRPIPRQLWPTKYEDVGADWINERYIDQIPGYIRAVGFAPPSGSAIGFLADLYAEFNYGVFPAAYLFGWAFAAVWRRHRMRGGIWTVLFVEMMILSVYIPTQSFSAWYHRFLFLAAGTIIFWRYFVTKELREQERKTRLRKALAND